MDRTMPVTRGVVLLSVLLVAAFSGCAAIARLKGDLSGGQVHKLARQIVSNVPAAKDGDGDRRFTWILVLPAKQDPNPEVTEAVLKQLRKNYEVFTELESVPADRIVRTEHGIEGFKSGFTFKFAIAPQSGGRIKVHYWTYGASRRSVARAMTYAWVDGDWRPVRKSPLS